MPAPAASGRASFTGLGHLPLLRLARFLLGSSLVFISVADTLLFPLVAGSTFTLGSGRRPEKVGTSDLESGNPSGLTQQTVVASGTGTKCKLVNLPLKSMGLIPDGETPAQQTWPSTSPQL